MPYVLLDDSSLSDIANAIRNRNKLVRTYKPREMAPAIRALKDLIPQSDGYEVRIAEYEHQKIKVSRYLNEEKTYTESFSSTKPFWKIRAEIEADPGYRPGTLNYPDELSVDRDIFIQATPAEEVVVPPDKITNLYWTLTYSGNYANLEPEETKDSRTMNNNQNNGFNRSYSVIPKPESRNVYNIYCPRDDGLPWNLGSLFTVHPHKYQLLVDATDVVFDFENKHGLVSVGSNRGLFEGEDWVENVQFLNWYTSDIEFLSRLIYNLPRLKSIGDISHWDMRSLITTVNLVQSSQYMQSLDLSGWDTPNLVTATNVFYGSYARILDISNWDTSKITSFSAGISAEMLNNKVRNYAYLIMDKEEVKFSGNYIFNNIANCKYLVPPTVLDDYKQHPNWQSRASQIDDITKYTINRGNGQISITPNI